MSTPTVDTVKCDVVVCGGGVAGCAAAIQAARSGAKTILLEKTVFPGGLATSGLVYIYLPICDGLGKQMVHGIGEEFLHESYAYGPGDVPKNWQDPNPKEMNQRFFTKFSPASFILRLDEMLEEAGVDVWFDTLLCAAETDENSRVRAVEVENKSGRIRIEGHCFIDATGDADLAVQCGAEVMAGTNKLSIWALEYDKHAGEDWHKLGEEIGRVVINKIDPEAEEYRGISGKGVSRFVLKTRALLRDHYKKAYQEGATREELFPLLIPSMADFRTTRFIKGKIVHDTSMDNEHFADSIGMIGDWTKCIPGFELPYGILLPEKVRGLLAAGRCISVQGESVERTRVIPVAAMTGQVAGLAAALAVKSGCMPDEISIEQLQTQLKELGFVFYK